MTRTIQSVIETIVAAVLEAPLEETVDVFSREEEEMRYLATWLQPTGGKVPITFVAAGDPVTTF